MPYWQIGKVSGNVPNWFVLELLEWRYQIVKRMFCIDRIILKGEGCPTGLPPVMVVSSYDLRDRKHEKSLDVIQITLTQFCENDFDMYTALDICREIGLRFHLYSSIVVEKSDKRHQPSNKIARFFLRPIDPLTAKQAFLQWDATPCSKFNCFVHCSPPMSPSMSKKTVCYKIPTAVIPELIPIPDEDSSINDSPPSLETTDVDEAPEHWETYIVA